MFTSGRPIVAMLALLCSLSTGHATTLALIANRVGAALSCDGRGCDATGRPVVDGVRKVFQPLPGLLVGAAGIARFQPGGVVVLDFTEVACRALAAQTWDDPASALARAGNEVGERLAALPDHPAALPPAPPTGESFIVLGAVRTPAHGPVVFVLEWAASRHAVEGGVALRFARRPTVHIHPVDESGCELLVQTRIGGLAQEASGAASGRVRCPAEYPSVRRFATAARRDTARVDLLARTTAELVRYTVARDPAIGGPILTETCAW